MMEFNLRRDYIAFGGIPHFDGCCHYRDNMLQEYEGEQIRYYEELHDELVNEDDD